MSDHVALISFHGAKLVTRVEDGVPYVAMRPIADHLGLSWNGQRERIRRHPVLNSCARNIRAQVPGDSQARDHVFLPISMLHGWLFGVQVNSTKPELRELLLAYQAECFAVLDAYWRGGVAVNPRIHDVPDDDPWSTAGDGRTQGERFAEERARWERDAGRSLVGILDFTKQKLRALEEFPGTLAKGDTLQRLIVLGFDVRYIYHGERVHTDAERAIRDAYRLGTDDDRAAIRRHAEAVRIRRSSAGWDRLDDRPDARYAGADTVRYLPGTPP